MQNAEGGEPFAGAGALDGPSAKRKMPSPGGEGRGSSLAPAFMRGVAARTAGAGIARPPAGFQKALSS